MPNRQNPYSVLKETSSLVRKSFPDFGPNKVREATRLVFEIAKRDGIRPENIIYNIEGTDYTMVKTKLLAQRYPTSDLKNMRAYLPSIELNKENAFKLTKKAFYPKTIFYESNVKNSTLLTNFSSRFPTAKTEDIGTLKAYISGTKDPKIFDYNKRRENIFIVHESYDFFKKCPCTKNAVGCGYSIFNLGFGCIFDCTYCYLQEYTNCPGIIFPANTEDFFSEFSKFKRPGMRIGTGEFADSLMLDNVTDYSKSIVPFFAQHPDTMFEFKTKSSNVTNLLAIPHKGNIVVSWSMNPEKIINNNEFYTASLTERLSAAKKCRDAGYRIGIHFDPVFYYEEWKNDYKNLIENIFSHAKPADIAWISIGTLRFRPSTKKVIESRFPENDILDGELVLDYDDKLRYCYNTRRMAYTAMAEMLYKHSKSLPVYLCMESSQMWKDVGIRYPDLYRPQGHRRPRAPRSPIGHNQNG